MARSAPSTTRLGVTVWYPLGIACAFFAMIGLLHHWKRDGAQYLDYHIGGQPSGVATVNIFVSQSGDQRPLAPAGSAATAC